VNTIYSLLNLQIDKEQNESAKKALLDAAARVQSMAVLINQLYSDGGVARLQSSREYFTTLAELAIGLFTGSEGVQLKLDLEEILLSEKTLSALGMILNELITNSMKYAFNHSESGSIIVKTRLVDQVFLFSYQDSGGEFLPHTLTSVEQQQGSGFGNQLIRLLMDQLRAKGGFTGEAEPQFSISIALET
jgi:two-component sensor histidine kinase